MKTQTSEQDTLAHDCIALTQAAHKALDVGSLATVARCLKGLHAVQWLQNQERIAEIKRDDLMRAKAGLGIRPARSPQVATTA